MPELNARIMRSESFLCRAVQNRIVLIPAGMSSADLEDLYALNEVGSRIWQMIDGQATIKEIAVKIAEHFKISLDQAQSDVLAFIRELQAIEAIETA